jgi:hypothetical protein
MYKKSLFFLVFFFPLLTEAKEIILDCSMNYGISGENDETEIEFKNLKKIDESQIFYLDAENNWFFNQSFEEYKNSEIKLSDIKTSFSDANIFTVAKYEKSNQLLSKHYIELNRYTGFVKHNFETNYDKIFRTGYCKLAKKKIF